MTNDELPLYSLRIKNEREKLKLTLRELSEKTEVPYNSIRNYEKGLRNITQKNAEKLSKYFNVSTPYLMGISDEVNPISEEKAEAIGNLIQEKLLKKDMNIDQLNKLLDFLMKNEDKKQLDSVLNSLNAYTELLNSLLINGQSDLIDNLTSINKLLEKMFTPYSYIDLEKTKDAHSKIIEEFNQELNFKEKRNLMVHLDKIQILEPPKFNATYFDYKNEIDKLIQDNFILFFERNYFENK